MIVALIGVGIRHPDKRNDEPTVELVIDKVLQTSADLDRLGGIDRRGLIHDDRHVRGFS